MAVAGGLDLHRGQLTFDYVDTGTGRELAWPDLPLRTGRACAGGCAGSPACRTWSSRSRGAPGGGTWWRNCSGPGSLRTWPSPPRRRPRGRKRRAKTDPLTDHLGVFSQLAGRVLMGVATVAGHERRRGWRRDLARLVVPRCGLLEATGDPFEPYRLVDARGVVVGPVAVYLRELQACGRPATTQRSYGMDLLRWFRFLWAAGMGGIRPPGRRPGISAGGFSWRPSPAPGAPRTGGARVRRGGKEAVNPVTGKPAPAVTYAAATRAHSESVLRAFYDLHLEAGTGPMVNPFPLSRAAGRPGECAPQPDGALP